jgi:hypothetical protein
LIHPAISPTAKICPLELDVTDLIMFTRSACRVVVSASFAPYALPETSIWLVTLSSPATPAAASSAAAR